MKHVAQRPHKHSGHVGSEPAHPAHTETGRAAGSYSMDIGAMSMNQLRGCTTPLTLVLMARGPTS